MSASESVNVRFLGDYRLQNFQFEFPKMKIREFVRVPTVSDWAKFAVQILKDEALTPLLTVGLLFIFGHLLRVHLATLKIYSVSQASPNFEQKTSPEVVNNSGNETGVSREGKRPGGDGRSGAKWVKRWSWSVPLRLLKQGVTFLKLIVLKTVTESERSCLVQCNNSTLMVVALAFISDVLQYIGVLFRDMCTVIDWQRCIPACAHTYRPHTLVSQ